MTASRRLLFGETSHVHCSDVILTHSSTQSSNLEGSIHGPLLWTLIFSSFLGFSIGFKSGNCLAILAALLSFSETIWVSLAVFGIIVSLKCPPSFHLHHPARWQKIFIKNVSVHSSIHPSLNYMYFASATPWCFGVMCSVIWPPNMVSIMAFKEYNFLSPLTRLFSASIS